MTLPSPSADSVSAETLRQLDQVCLDFEAAWQAGQRPRPEDFIGRTSAVTRERLLLDLLRLDLHYRRQAGERPTLAEYHARFPDDDPLIWALFIPGYKVLSELGRGGFGVVYLVRRAGSEEDRFALKVIRRTRDVSEQEVRRFRFELETMATLDHPHIVRIQAVDEFEGLPFGCLQYLDGGSLADKFKAGPLGCEDAARLMIPVAQAIHHAHQRGILHRDLKPGNILLDSNGGPFATDFGLARRVAAESGPTITGQVIGTPAYMAPEQVEGKRGGITTATDVHGLGAILYQCLTGKAPFEAETLVETLHRVTSEDRVPPHNLNPAVHPWLEKICLKCLEKEPGKRYASAEDLAADLTRFHEGRRPDVCSLRPFDAFADFLGIRPGVAERFTRLRALFLVAFAFFEIAWYALLNWVLVTDQHHALVWVAIVIPYLLLFAMMFVERWRHGAPWTVERRHHWSLWIAHMLGLFAILISAQFLPGLDKVLDLTSNRRILLMWPAGTALTGTVMFIQGTHFTGRHYLFGLGYIVLAILTPFWLEWAPLVTGIVTGAMTFAVGMQFLRVKGKLRANRGSEPVTPTEGRA